MRINQHVITQFGPGYVQGGYEGGYLVRIELKDLADPNAIKASITPHAHKSGLWVIPENEIRKY
jgi:hypothetical protein